MVFEDTLSVQVVISNERTSCEHVAVPLQFGVLCVSVRPGRFVAPVSFQLSLHVFCVNVAMSSRVVYRDVMTSLHDGS